MTCAAFVRRLALLSGLASVAAATSASAAGFYLQEQSARGVGRAFSGEAADVGPQSLWWNPASIAGQSTGEAYMGTSVLMPGSKATNTGTLIVRPTQTPAPVGGIQSTGKVLLPGVLPSGAFSVPVNDKIDLGLALTAPFDFTTKYGGDSWARYTAMTTSLRTIDVQPTAAVALTPWLRIGGGANAEHADAILSNALPNLSPLLPDGYERLAGSNWDWGWSVGAQAHNDVVTIGVSYKSSIDHHLGGRLNIHGLLGPLAPFNLSTPINADFKTPWQAIAGVRYRASRQLTLDLQAIRVGWSEFNAIQIGQPIGLAVPENYHDSWTVAGGFDYDFDPRWTGRAGVEYDQSPVGDGLRDARVPDADRVNFAVGGSYHASSRITFDGGVSYVMFMNAHIDRPTAAYVGTPAQTPILADGELTDAHVVVLSLGVQTAF